MTSPVQIVKTTFSKNKKIEVHHKDGKLLKLSSGVKSVLCSNFASIQDPTISTFYNTNELGELKVVNTMAISSNDLETTELDLYNADGTFEQSLIDNGSVEVDRSIVSTYPMVNINWEQSFTNLMNKHLLPVYSTKTKEYLLQYKKVLAQYTDKIKKRITAISSATKSTEAVYTYIRDEDALTGTIDLTYKDFNSVLAVLEHIVKSFSIGLKIALKSAEPSSHITKDNVYNLDVIGETPNNIVDNYKDLDVYTIDNGSSLGIIYINFTAKPTSETYNAHMTGLYFNYLDHIIQTRYTELLKDMKIWEDRVDGMALKEEFLVFLIKKTAEGLISMSTTLAAAIPPPRPSVLTAVSEEGFNFNNKLLLSLSALSVSHDVGSITLAKPNTTLTPYVEPSNSLGILYLKRIQAFINEVVSYSRYETVKNTTLLALTTDTYHGAISNIHDHEFKDRSTSGVHYYYIQNKYQGLLQEIKRNKFKWVYISTGVLLFCAMTFIVMKKRRC
jgi:hypothetical protein